MPRSRSNSRLLQLLGVLAAVIGVVGYTVFGWRFGGTSDSVATAIAVVCVVAAVVATVLRR